MTPPRQLALPFPHAPHYEDATFCAAPSNQSALTWLGRAGDWPGGQLAIWGEEGRGKTHLLHRWGRAHRAEMIEGPAVRGLRAPNAPALVIDDADASAEEEALLRLLNLTRELGTKLLISGRTPPARWPVKLPDLASRLRAMTAVELSRPEDALLRALLGRMLTERQLAVPEALQDWLLLRLPRSAGAIREVACRLDHAALAAGGRVNRVLAAAVVAEMQAVPDDVLASFDASISPDHALLL